MKIPLTEYHGAGLNKQATHGPCGPHYKPERSPALSFVVSAVRRAGGVVGEVGINFDEAPSFVPIAKRIGTTAGRRDKARDEAKITVMMEKLTSNP